MTLAERGKVRPGVADENGCGASARGLQMNTVWKTKYGSRRVRRELPTMAEAITAARDITDDREGQAEIAASLMGVPLDDTVRAAVAKAGLMRRPVQAIAF